MGDPERGRTIFEGIIETHRKRLDLWNVYIDMEAGQRDLARIRYGVRLAAKYQLILFLEVSVNGQ